MNNFYGTGAKNSSILDKEKYENLDETLSTKK